MAYQIAYDYKDIKKEQVKNISAVTYILAVLGVVAALSVTQIGGTVLDYLLMEEHAKIAAEDMIESIRSGEKLDAAIDAFCRDLSDE